MSSYLQQDAVSPEYTLYLDSHNRVQDCKDPENPTNDITIPTNMGRTRLPVTQMYLGSLELKLEQYLIERKWNRLYFNEGIALSVNTVADLPLREFTVNVNGTPFTAVIPMWLNPISSAVFNGSTVVITTQFEHGLENSNAWNWGQGVRLISTDQTDPTLVQLNSTNPNFSIIDDFRFQITNFVGATLTGTLPGFVHAPVIPSPRHLANVITFALNGVIPDGFQVTYDTDTSLFSIRTTLTKGQTCRTLTGTITTDTVQLVIPSSNSLPSLMGFGYGTITLPTTSTDCSPSERPDTKCDPFTFTGQFGYQCNSFIDITPGNYGAADLASQLYLQFNRFFFDPGCDADPANRNNFVFSDPSGTCIVIPIEYGLYTPDTFAEYLQDQMDANDTTGNTYTVTWDPDRCTFIFSSDNTFGLEFANANDSSALRLGFSAVNMRGKTQYESNTSFCTPLKQCCGTNIPTKFTSYVYSPTINTSTRRFTIFVDKVRVLDTDVADIGGSTQKRLTVTVGGNPVAHGYQPDDVIIFIDTGGGGDTFELRVTNVVDAFTFDVEPGSTGLTGGASGSSQLSGVVASNLILSQSQLPQITNQLPPRILGFHPSDVLYQSGVTPPFTAPYNYDVDAPSYVLVEVDVPKGATHNNHAWNNDNKDKIFAKVILYPQFRFERIYPMNMYLPQVERISELKMRILNPDHTLYQFHGRDWSATICFRVAEDLSSNAICY